MKAKQIIVTRVIIVALILISVSTGAYAQSGATNPTGNTKSGVTAPTSETGKIFTLQNPLKVNSIGGLVQTFIEIASYVLILFAVIMFIYVGFQYVLNAAQGNAAKIKELHKQFMWLVIGVAIVVSARVIVQIVINTLSATGVVSPGIIQNTNNALQGK